ncbi:MAG: type II toxin-antitoxin system VapC family toxin [Tepidiformaceae bacterium]
MNVVDSSAWLEYFADGPNSSAFEAAINDLERLLVPTVVVLEVRRRLLQLGQPQGTADVLLALTRGRSVPLDAALALEAARLGVAHQLPLADSIIYATGQRFGATVWTQDADFKDLPGVEYRPGS